MVTRRLWPGSEEKGCEFLGRHKGNDLYVCPGAGGPSVVFRFGREGSEHHSEPYFIYERQDPSMPPVPAHPISREAVRRWELRHGRRLTKQTVIRPSGRR